MSAKEILERYNFDFNSHLKNDENVEDGDPVLVLDHESFKLSSLQMENVHVPSSKEYMIFEHRSLKSGRVIRLLSCRHKDCGRVFRRMQSFFDHLRIHT